jgi:N-acyl homoserine lactone hydrolase
VVLLDTGMGSHPDADAHYQPERVDLRTALRARGVGLVDVSLVVNCHLHFDHCGGNPLFAGTPLVTQRRELELAHGEDYTLPELVDFDGARYEPLEGPAELLPGVHVLFTPGHTDGHQSLAIRSDDGTVVLAGQALEHASDLTAAVVARELAGRESGRGLEHPPWLDDVLTLDPRRVLFAHDEAVWEPSPPSS